LQINYNYITVSGEVEDMPSLYNRKKGVDYYLIHIAYVRTSNTKDYLDIIAPFELIKKINWNDTKGIVARGTLRNFTATNKDTYNNLVVLAEEVQECEDYGLTNEVDLEGYVCNDTYLRETPSGRLLTDITLAVNREHGADYIQCITWGRIAKDSTKLDVGDYVSIKGRLQSRMYFKKTGDEYVGITVREVSVTDLSVLRKKRGEVNAV
jgi:primosomal replication protein N